MVAKRRLRSNFQTMPDRPLLLYDGGCRFCRWAARVVASLDRQRQLALLPFEDAASYLAGIPDEERYSSWHLIDPDGRRFTRGQGGLVLLERLPATRLLGRAIPGRLADRLYDVIARHRDRLGHLVPDRPGPRRPP